MASYDDENWVQILKSLGLAANEYAAAKLLLVGKDAAFRKVMLGDDKVSNKNVIFQALGEFWMPCWGYMWMLVGNRTRRPLQHVLFCGQHLHVIDTVGM